MTDFDRWMEAVRQAEQLLATQKALTEVWQGRALEAESQVNRLLTVLEARGACMHLTATP